MQVQTLAGEHLLEEEMTTSSFARESREQKSL